MFSLKKIARKGLIKLTAVSISWIDDRGHIGNLKSIFLKGYINGLVQDCSNSIANALGLLQSCTKPST